VYVINNSLQAKIANAKIGFGKAKARGWVELVKCDNVQKVARKVCLFHLFIYSQCVDKCQFMFSNTVSVIDCI